MLVEKGNFRKVRFNQIQTQKTGILRVFFLNVRFNLRWKRFFKVRSSLLEVKLHSHQVILKRDEIEPPK